MIAHRLPFVAVTLAIVLAPIAARAQSHGTPAAAQKPAATGETHASTPAAKPAPTRSSGGDRELAAAMARIDTAVQAAKAQEAAHPSPSRRGAPSPTASRARIQLRWRIDLTWPADLADAPDPSTDSRVALTWR